MNQSTVCNETLDALQRDAFLYFLQETNPANGLVRDKTPADELPWAENAPASIAAVGFALAAYPVGVERGLLTRTEAVARTLATLRFFWTSPQGPEPDATGYKGFYYHFLDMQSGRRIWQCELSTVDSAFLLAGMLAAAAYFNQDAAEEHEIRTLADALYRRADWPWARNGGATVTHGWRPEDGFLKYRWEGYDEALLLYALGLGSPTYPLPEESYTAWTSTYQWKEIYGYEFLYAGALFIHQFSHLWIDFRGIQDHFLRGKGIDYFENSRRATLVQQQYAVRNPLAFDGYGPYFWGLTTSDGPGWTTRRIRGVERRFFDYLARGVPHGPDDGTVAPWAVVTSLPFTPEVVLATVRDFREVHPEVTGRYCFKCSFNLTFTDASQGKPGWTSAYHYGINLGPIVLMIENHRSGLLWRLMRRCPYLVTGLRRAGFTDGWL
ncbi:MAG: hypothetical protein L0Z62_14485 [Gemmataceae bacterium]|nr:hypothetical protein [Gemmataceae bacterium]